MPGRKDRPLDVEYEVVDVADVRASHLPGSDFAPNPEYGLENERQYHAEPASKAKVIGNAGELEPDLVLRDGGTAETGSPVVDSEGNVLGGNGRAMTLAVAYDRFPKRAEEYRKALVASAASYGIDPERVRAMERPMLVRRAVGDRSREERQRLVADLNGSFTHSKERKAAGKSRGASFSRGTLATLARAMSDTEATSLRDFFDRPESRAIVDAMIEDGVLMLEEQNEFVAADGMLNPDGKRAVEEALRGRVMENYSVMNQLSADVLGKIDAAIPNLLQVQTLKDRKWDCTEALQGAIRLAAGFRASGLKTADAFLRQKSVLTGTSPAETEDKRTLMMFSVLVSDRKQAFVKRTLRYANEAKRAGSGVGMLMAPPSPRATFARCFAPEE